jgi:hypothetical protein
MPVDRRTRAPGLLSAVMMLLLCIVLVGHDLPSLHGTTNIAAVSAGAPPVTSGAPSDAASAVHVEPSLPGCGQRLQPCPNGSSPLAAPYATPLRAVVANEPAADAADHRVPTGTKEPTATPAPHTLGISRT